MEFRRQESLVVQNWLAARLFQLSVVRQDTEILEKGLAMTFSLRFAFAGIAIVAIWLAAMTSGSSLAVEIVTALTLCLIPLSLVFAICDARKRQRMFWIGFFIFCVSGMLGRGHLARIHFRLATLACGPSPIRASSVTTPNTFIPIPPTQPMPPTSTTSPAPAANVIVSVPPGAIPIQSDYVDKLNATLEGIPILTSLLLGILGGCTTMWVADRQEKKVSKNQQVAAEP